MELKLEEIEKLQNDIELLMKKYTDGTGIIKEWKVQSIAGSIVKNLIMPLVRNNDVAVCDCDKPNIYINKRTGIEICFNCYKPTRQTDC